MTSLATFELLQFVLLFGISIVFTAFGITRQTLLTYLLASVMWIATGLINFILSPTGVVSAPLSYLAIALGVIFMLAAFKSIGDSVMESKESRWKVGL